MEPPNRHTNPLCREKESIFAQPLESLTLLCCRFPAAVLVGAFLIGMFGLYWSYEHLGLKMSRLDLINPKSSFNKLWLDYIDEFGDDNEAIVVVEGANDADVIAVLQQLTERIEQYPQFYQGALYGVDLSAIHRKGLHYVPIEDLRTIERFVIESLNRAAPGAVQSTTANIPIQLLQTLTKSDIDGDMSYFLFPTDEGVIGFVLLRLINIDKTQFSQGTKAIENLRSIIRDVRVQHPALQMGLTGMPILEYDEMAMSNDAMIKATLLAFVGVCIIFMAGFGSLRHPLLAVFTLAVAFAWTMGYITLAVGHLNILSIAFGAMLVGLGTDFTVHFLGRYLDLRRDGGNVDESLCLSARLVGPGIVTGALTTASAFFAASFAEFTGVAELGIIVGGGILCCVISTFTVFPAMIVLMTPTSPNKKTPSYNLYDIRPILKPFFFFPKMTLGIFSGLFLFLLLGIPNVWYDYNLLNLQPKGLESVELEQRLLSLEVEKGGKNVWFALSIADTNEELLKRKRLFEERYPELKTEEIVSFFPEADPEKVRIIQSLATMLHNVPATTSSSGSWGSSGGTENLLNVLNTLNTLKTMAVPELPTVDDLPESLVSRFVGQRGKHLMRIYTTANIWDMDEMEKFVAAVRDIDPDATGSPLQTYESSIQMREGFIAAAFYALIAVLIFTWIDFRSLKASFGALLPMFLGVAMMFGILGWLNLPLNPANMIVLPLVIGISIDYGIHLIHDFRNRTTEHYIVSSSTATAILITSLTSAVGFGSMMIACHQGLQSLGRVLVIGMTCCLITSVVVLPAILSLRVGNAEKTPGSEPPKPKRLVRREPD